MDYLTKEALYELLDIDTPADFQYFENLAALLECEDEIDDQALAQLLEGVDKKTLAELLHNYFEEMTDNYVPTPHKCPICGKYVFADNLIYTNARCVRIARSSAVVCKAIWYIFRVGVWGSRNPHVFGPFVAQKDNKCCPQ